MRYRNLHREKNSGVALLVVVWVMVLLAVLAISLGRRVGMELSLTRYRLAKLRADALVRAGVIYAMDFIREDTRDKESGQFDTMAACGIKPVEGREAGDVFRHVVLGVGYFDVGYQDDPDGPDPGRLIYGFKDEERKININAVTQRTKNVLAHLAMLLGATQEEARTIAASVIDWHDEDENPTDPPYGAESAEYEVLPKPYRCKNRPFENIQELLFVRGISPEMFLKMKDYVTVFPLKTSELKINPATAAETVLRAVAESVVDPAGNAGPEDADSLARKIVSYRRGPDGREGTADDRRVRMNDLALNAEERTLFLMMAPLTTEVSQYFRVRVRGVDTTTSTESAVEAVIERNSLSVVYWREGGYE